MDSYKETCSAFAGLAKSSYNLYAMRIDHLSDGGIAFGAHSLSVAPVSAWREYLQDVCEKYVTGKNPVITEDADFLPYDNQALCEQDFFISNKDDACVCDGYKKFLMAIDDCRSEHAAESMRPNAMVFSGMDEDGRRATFLSVHAPFVTLKHRFVLFEHEYQAVRDPVLTLSTNIDAVIFGETLYFLTPAGAQAFVSDSICKKIAKERVDRLEKLSFVNGIDILRSTSQKGLNPKRFLAYSESRVKALNDPKRCKVIMKKFSIPYSNGMVDVDDPADAEKFIKVICNRGMEDPFSKNPVEVSGSRAWKVAKK